MKLSNLAAVLLALVIVTSACSSDGEVTDGAEIDSSQVTNVDGSGDSAADTDVASTPIVAGAPLNPFDLRAGQCFNQDSWYDEERERRIELTASIDCGQPHQREVFFEQDFPAPGGAPFPGDVKMTEWSTELCYSEFEDFVGLEYELSRYEISFIQPTQATFEHEVGRHRRVTCVLFDIGGDDLIGSARDTGV